MRNYWQKSRAMASQVDNKGPELNPNPGKTGRRFIIFSAIALLLIGAQYIWVFRDWFTHPPLSFSGNSADLNQTIIVPTLDSAKPTGKNVVWCASFQYAWNELRDNIVGKPIQLANAQAIADLLNASTCAVTDAPADSVTSAAGFVARGKTEAAIRDLTRHGQSSLVKKTRTDVENELIAFAHMSISTQFKTPFQKSSEGLHFSSASGKESVLRSFGITENGKDQDYLLHTQPRVLFAEFSDANGSEVPAGDISEALVESVSEFAIDLDSQAAISIVVAVIPRRDSLAEDLSYLRDKTADGSMHSVSDSFRPREVLLVPELNWDISHRFSMMEGLDKIIANLPGAPPVHIDAAVQNIEFRLDRSGIRLVSSAHIGAKATSAALPVGTRPVIRHFLCNRPFLIIAKKRDAPNPFFVMWVDNAELLCKR